MHMCLSNNESKEKRRISDDSLYFLTSMHFNQSKGIARHGVSYNFEMEISLRVLAKGEKV